MKQRDKALRSSAMLTLTAMIWGAAFVAQSEGLNYVGGFTFNACRFLLGGAVLIPCILLLRLKGEKASSLDLQEKASSLVGGLCCGLVFFVASSLQQFGMVYTTVGKAGFITALYIIIVPILGIFLKKRVGRNIWLSVLLAAVGMYLLCITEDFSIGRGDILVFLCAIVFSLHILSIDYFSPKANGMVLSCVQFLVAGSISAILMMLFEKPSWQAIRAAGVPILYAGVLSCAVAYTLQVIAQKDIDPTRASLIMSLESVFSLLAGWVLLNQKLSARELLGCAMVFGGILLAQLPTGKSLPAMQKGADK